MQPRSTAQWKDYFQRKNEKDELFIPPEWVIPKSLHSRKEKSDYITSDWNGYHDSYTGKDYETLQKIEEDIAENIAPLAETIDKSLDHGHYLTHLTGDFNTLLDDHPRDTKLEEIFGIPGDEPYRLGDATVEQSASEVGENYEYDYHIRLPEYVLDLKNPEWDF